VNEIVPFTAVLMAGDCIVVWLQFLWKRTIDRFHSIFLLWQLEGEGSCDVDINQSVGSMVM